MDFYGNAVIASGDFIAEHPDAVRGFNRPSPRACSMSWPHPEEAVDMVAKVDPLIDKKLEVARLEMAIEMNILTPYVKEHGFGDVDPARLASSIDQLARPSD